MSLRSRLRTRARAALLAALALLGCSGGHKGGEPSAGEADVGAAVQECLSPADESRRGSCVDAWAASHPGQIVAFAARLVRVSPPAPALALRALRRAPESDEKAALMVEIAGVALSKGMLAEAEEALAPRLSGSATPVAGDPTATAAPAPPSTPRPSPTRGGQDAGAPPPDAGAAGGDDLGDMADAMRAELYARQGEWVDAFRLHAMMAERDPTAEEHVVKAVEMLVRDPKGGSVVEYCRSLQKHGGGGSGGAAPRPLQVLACVRAGVSAKALSQEDGEPLALDALAEIPALRLEEIQRLAPPGLRALETAAACHAKGAPAAPAAKGRAWRGREAAVYVRLAEGHQDDAVRLCYLRLAKNNCLEGIKAGKRCSNLWSFGMYLQLLAKVDKQKLSDELGALIESDNGLRESPEGEVRQLIRTKDNLYRSLTTSRSPGAAETEEQILRALLDIHLVLAHVLTTQPELAGPSGVLSPGFHVKRAQSLWEKLSPGKELPEEMLPEGARSFLVRRPPRASAAQVRPQ